MGNIIIDGVDVSGCKFYNDCRCSAQEHYAEGEFLWAEKCEECIDCYYKQLQRAKAEIKELKKELEKHKSKIRYLLSPLIDSDFQNKLKKLEQENKQLKAALFICKPQDVIDKINKVIGDNNNG